MKLPKFVVLSLLVGILIVGISSINHFSIAESLEWGYTGSEGPSNWGDISPEFSACKIGKEQSPINIEDSSNANLPELKLAYNSTPFDIVNNGHSIQINYEPGSSMTIGGKKYQLLQFHFHSPSEHTLNGKSYPMETHLVHQSEDGELAVLGIFITEGNENEFIEALWSSIPETGVENTVSGIEVNVNALLPEDLSYYHYTGSLTTPPCSEGVNWNVLKTTIELSSEQLAGFNSFYNGNARPVQPLNDRELEATR